MTRVQGSWSETGSLGTARDETIVSFISGGSNRGQGVNLGSFGTTAEGALSGLKRNDPRKIAIARVIRARTAVTNEWIARELALGHVTNVSRSCSDKFKQGDLPRFTP